ncbi:hypothetical protein D3C79_630550 [compost metagenome]
MDHRQRKLAKYSDICPGLEVQRVQAFIEKVVEQRGEAGREAVVAFMADAGGGGAEGCFQIRRRCVASEAAVGAIQRQLRFVFDVEQQRPRHYLPVNRECLDIDTFAFLAKPFRVLEHAIDRALLLSIELAGCPRHIPTGPEHLQVLVLGMDAAADGGVRGSRLPVMIPLPSDRCGKVQLSKPGEQLRGCQAQGRMVGGQACDLGVLVEVGGRLGILARV